MKANKRLLQKQFRLLIEDHSDKVLAALMKKQEAEIRLLEAEIEHNRIIQHFKQKMREV